MIAVRIPWTLRGTQTTIQPTDEYLFTCTLPVAQLGLEVRQQVLQASLTFSFRLGKTGFELALPITTSNSEKSCAILSVTTACNRMSNVKGSLHCSIRSALERWRSKDCKSDRKKGAVLGCWTHQGCELLLRGIPSRALQTIQHTKFVCM